MPLEVVKVDFCKNFIDFSVNEIRRILKKKKKVVFVSPNRRPLRFIEMQLEPEEIFEVNLYTINDFVDKLCSVYRPDLRRDSKLTRELFFLKLIRDKFENKDCKAFVWAKRLSELFNDFDKQLVDSIENIKYVEISEDAIKIVESLKELFEKYKREYKNVIFEGKASAIAGEIVESEDFLMDFEGYVFLFAGFGSMSKSEIRLVNSIADRFDLSLVVQTDNLGRDRIGDISFDNCWVVEKFIKGLRVNSIKEIKCEKDETHIEFYEFNSRHAEASFVAQILNKTGDVKSPFKIGIVTPENDAILPFLSFVKRDVNLNITATYPFKLTPLGGFLKSLFEMLMDAQRRNFKSLNPKLLLRVLNSGFTRYFGNLNRERILSYLYDNPSVSVNVNRFESLKKIVKIFEDINDFKGLKEAFLSLFDNLNMGILRENVLDLYSLNLFFEEVIENLPVEEKEINVDIIFAYYFIKEFIEDLEIPFEGHPLKGIQVLGVLESRMLGFDELFVLDANENVLPKSGKIDPLLPEELKKAFGLTTFYEKEKLIRYNFFRLVYSSKKVHILYKTSTVSDEKSQRSRYVEQLMILNGLKGESDKPRVYMPKLTSSNFDIKIDKDALKNYIKDKLEGKGFSPSEINEFIRCPYAFYLHRVKKIENRTFFGERFESDKIGTIIHRMLQKEFEKYRETGEIITLEKYQSIKDNMLSNLKSITTLSDIVKGNDAKELVAYLKNMEPIRKKALLVVLRYRIENFFKETSKKFKDFRVKYIEKEFKSESLHLFGVLDRVDEIGGKIRVVDYKTGYHSQGYKNKKIESLEFEKIEDCCDFVMTVNDIYYSIQMPIYMVMVKEQFASRNVYGEIYYLGSSDRVVEEFKAEHIDIHRKVLEILMRRVKDCQSPCAFSSEFCSFCDFNRFCPYSR
ncbi:PD-(D/E)XK nuclease family protein [Hippea alviniae]|uniref:PD-(D/E)XK nuclease family protein n=1 Tax=Hippea alviniae TaxID=1279027 RepID=UPI0003B791CF|nr:PD-(D/E)XK nuclease family protein [Hippea alviniae]